MVYAYLIYHPVQLKQSLSIQKNLTCHWSIRNIRMLNSLKVFICISLANSLRSIPIGYNPQLFGNMKESVIVCATHPPNDM